MEGEAMTPTLQTAAAPSRGRGKRGRGDVWRSYSGFKHASSVRRGGYGYSAESVRRIRAGVRGGARRRRAGSAAFHFTYQLLCYVSLCYVCYVTLCYGIS